MHPSDDPPVSVCIDHSDPHRPVEDQSSEGLAGPLAVRLTPLRCIDVG
jgi:hypothetical protein